MTKHLAALFILFALVASVAAIPKSDAQTAANQLFVSWSTNTYVPPGYHGKQLPTSGSPITAWIVLFNHGVPVNLSGYSIHWYADNELMQSGQGLQKISFKAPAATEQIVALQARAEDASGNLYVANIQVPVIGPKAAIEADYPGGVVAAPSVNVEALPYFFNVSDPSSLTYAWSANGVAAQSAENPSAAVINIGEGTAPGAAIGIKLAITNPSDSTAATANTTLTYQKP